ncbi:serine/threonine-protein kinase [Cognatiluteimonas weifangensis]|uniref:Serine/threonine protein kinase n=1 Tax=Cognatiluteimonas weifangensis TaxID=2303539 RepID=A0A372DHQ6_9GAMM|nr:serine/threonine-protein kinase [Luteimonas weifangensis]RFP59014.1 serine/threonine protein kinase [Luteimonas weifangensis]
MDAERWQRLSPLLDAMFELDAATRARSLASLREEDPQLGADLAELMALEEARGDFLSQPLVPALPGPRPGTLAGPYRLERLLGEGGMGQVWLASRADGLYQRRVALKLLRPGLADPNLQLRFTRERQILARLAHPHIARLLDAGISGDGQPYLALEYVDGEPITDWCRSRALSLEARLRLFLQVCDAVSHAHANLIVHRDLKPSNILVTPLDEVRLLDFGIAKLLDTNELSPEHTGTGLRAFTLHYAAPEQIRGEPITTMTDVYSLGVVLYELLTGSKPYRLKRQTDAEWEEAILTADPMRPSLCVLRGGDTTGAAQPQRRLARALAGDLDNIVLKALAKRPEQRYPSVEALALDLARYRDGKPVLARPQSVGYRLRKYLHRHRWALSTAALVTAVLASAFGIVAWQARQAVQEASRAQALQDFVVGLFQHAGGGNGEDPLDVRQLLDAGVARGNRELARQPAARAELFGVIARLRLGLGDYVPALQLLERQALIVDALGDDAPPSLRLESTTDRGRAQLLLGDARACIAAMAPRQSLAQREQRQLPVQVAEFWSQLGRCQRAIGAADTARPLFLRSLALRRDALDDDAGVVENLADLAGLHADAGELAAARRGYRDALRQLRERVGSRHPLSIALLRNLCAVQRSAGDTIGAQRDCGNALALARELHGDDHPASIDARRQLATIQVDIGRYAEAEATFRDSRAWLVARLGPDHDSVARDDNSLGIIAWERGHPVAALAALDRSIAVRRRRGNPLELAGVLFNKAMVLHELRRNTEARPLLLEARRLRSEHLGPAHPLVGDSDRLLGEIDAALGDRARALAELRAAAQSTRDGYGAAHPHARRAQLSLAALQAASGDAAALARLDALAELASQPEIELRKVAWLAGAAAAAQRCHGPERMRALASLQALQAEVRNAQPEGGVTARQVAARQASCL